MLSDVVQYIVKFDKAKQERLAKIRSIIFELYPDAGERIYYGIPTVERCGKALVSYAAYKKHISLIIGNVLPAILKEKYPQYKYTDYTALFPDNEPFPEDFVKMICELCGEACEKDILRH